MSRVAVHGALLTVLLATTAIGQTLDDPTRPYRGESPGSTQGDTRQPFVLNGVLMAQTRRVAVINGGLYREGDLVNGARVVRIDARSVELRHGERSLVVKLPGEPPKSLVNRGEPSS